MEIFKDMFGNQIEIGRAVADRAISLTINEPKFGHQVLIRLDAEQARELAAMIGEAADEIG